MLDNFITSWRPAPAPITYQTSGPLPTISQHRFAPAYRVSFIERTGPFSLYGGDQGAFAFLGGGKV